MFGNTADVSLIAHLSKIHVHPTTGCRNLLHQISGAQRNKSMGIFPSVALVVLRNHQWPHVYCRVTREAPVGVT